MVSSLGKFNVFYFMVNLVEVNDLVVDVVFIVKQDDQCLVLIVLGRLVIIVSVFNVVLVLIMWLIML